MWDFLTAYALTDYSFQDAMVFATEEVTLNLHVGTLLAVVIGGGAWVCSLLAQWSKRARLDPSRQVSATPETREAAATVVRE